VSRDFAVGQASRLSPLFIHKMAVISLAKNRASRRGLERFQKKSWPQKCTKSAKHFHAL